MPRRDLEGIFGAARRYALPQNAPQRAIWVEVRKKAGGEMCPIGAWEGTSGRRDVTHFREMCHRRPSGGEVRKRVEEGMCLGGAWEAGSETGGVTHFREMCHRKPSRWKCVRGWKKGCALEGPGRQVRRRAALRTSGKCATEGRLDGSA